MTDKTDEALLAALRADHPLGAGDPPPGEPASHSMLRSALARLRGHAGPRPDDPDEVLQAAGISDRVLADDDVDDDDVVWVTRQLLDGVFAPRRIAEAMDDLIRLAADAADDGPIHGLVISGLQLTRGRAVKLATDGGDLRNVSITLADGSTLDATLAGGATIEVPDGAVELVDCNLVGAMITATGGTRLDLTGSDLRGTTIAAGGDLITDDCHTDTTTTITRGDVAGDDLAGAVDDILSDLDWDAMFHAEIALAPVGSSSIRGDTPDARDFAGEAVVHPPDGTITATVRVRREDDTDFITLSGLHDGGSVWVSTGGDYVPATRWRGWWKATLPHSGEPLTELRLRLLPDE